MSVGGLVLVGGIAAYAYAWKNTRAPSARAPEEGTEDLSVTEVHTRSINATVT
jgi:hypothetical protein